MQNLSSRITIMAIGVSNYNDPLLQNLRGPMHDIRKVKQLFVENKKTALFNNNQFIKIENPEAEQLRKLINEYLMGRSAEGDILIFYFSGHGVSIGRDDFGFCAIDTMIHPNTHVALPLSVIKFSEILSSINLSNVIPVFIIDACYSGIAGKALNIPPIEAMSNLQQQIHSMAASSYALLCSCSEIQTSNDTAIGGVFSNLFIDVATNGLTKKEVNESTLTLKDIFPKLNEKVLSYSGESTPRLYLGATLPEFPLVINSQFAYRRYSLSGTYISILEELWNNGDVRDLNPDEIGNLCGNGAYCNHNKLSFSPWDLVETIPGTKNRRLTERGKEFMLGKLQVPKVVIKDPRTGIVIAAPETNSVTYPSKNI